MMIREEKCNVKSIKENIYEVKGEGNAVGI